MRAQPLKDNLDAGWKSFVDSAAGLDPSETITSRSYAEGTLKAPTISAGADATIPAPVALPELPELTMATSDAPGEVDFEVTGVLGEGGMGRVLLARQRSLRRDVAIKTVKADKAKREVLDALLAEAVVTGTIEHPNVVPVHALGRDAQGQPLLVMKRIEGVSWRDLVRDPAHPAWATIAPDTEDRLDAHLDIFMSVCNAIHFAHSRSFIHRDIKLTNIMIGSFGEVYVVDWGIALRAALPGEVRPRRGPPVGTLTYMSPEMVVGDLSRVDARTDVYLLGATLHAALTGGRGRHAGESLYDVLVSARASKPFAYGPDVPAELGAICNKAMSANPEDRFPSALSLRRAIASFRRHRGSVTLSDQAAAQLTELRGLLSARRAGETVDERRIHELMTECRFGFMQALRSWKENDAARVGLQGCLEVMIEHELGQRDAEGARALYAELPEPRPALLSRVASLEADLRGAAAREARLVAMERDQDLSIGARTQLAVVGLFATVAVLGMTVVFKLGEREPSRRSLITVPTVGLLLMLLTILVARRRLQAAVSRRALEVLTLLPAGVVLHRVLVTTGGSQVSPIFTADLLMGALTSGAIAIALIPRVGWVAIPCVLGALGTTLWPAFATQIFAGCTMIGFFLLVLVWLWSVRS